MVCHFDYLANNEEQQCCTFSARLAEDAISAGTVDGRQICIA